MTKCISCNGTGIANDAVRTFNNLPAGAACPFCCTEKAREIYGVYSDPPRDPMDRFKRGTMADVAQRAGL